MSALSFPPPSSYPVSYFGAVGDGVTDDTAALTRAITRTPVGSVLNFGGPGFIYLISSSLTLLPFRTYLGQNATIKMSGSATGAPPLAKALYGASNDITVSGIVFDGNGVGSGVRFNVEGGIATPTSNLIFTGNVIRSTTPTPADDSQGALYCGSGLVSSFISGNRVLGCGKGMAIINPHFTEISDNDFDVISDGNAISVSFYIAPYTYGAGVKLSRNSGRHLSRMAIEVFPGETPSSSITGMEVSSNHFTTWDTPIDGFPFGISVVAGSAAVITGNHLIAGPSTGVGWGIELAAPLSTVTNNSITGFDSGIAIEDAQGSTVSYNLCTSPTSYGIVITNQSGIGTRTNLTIEHNVISEAKLSGVFVNTAAWSGSVIRFNQISRTGGGWAGDSTATFTGISIFPPSAPVTVESNSIIQSASAGPSGFTFVGIAVNGGTGANLGSVYASNYIATKQTLTASSGFYGNSSGGMNGTTVRGNVLVGLNGASGGVGSSGVIALGNVLVGCAGVGPTPINH